MGKMTIRAQSQEVWEALELVMDEVLLEPAIPAIMKADLQQTVASELERLRNLNIYGHEVLWYNAMVAGNFIERAIEAMQEEQRPSVDRRQWSEFLYQSAQEEQEEDEDDDEQMTEEEIVDILVDELWSRLPDEPYPEQIEFVLLEVAMDLEDDQCICIGDDTLEKVINEYRSFTDREIGRAHV